MANEALAAAARWGPYFTWAPYDGDAGWRPFRDLLDGAVIGERVEAGRRTLARLGGLAAGDIEERAVASIIFLGLASRLLSPLLGAVALTGSLPVPDIDRMWWRPVEGGPMPIAFRDLDVVAGHDVASGPDETADHGAGWLTVVEPVLETFRTRYQLSPQVLWGNVASALGGAAGMIADAASDGTGDAGAARRAAAAVELLLRREPLRGSAALVQPDPSTERWFLVRNNCCLYYRIPGGGTCGDCVLTPEHVRRQQWRVKLGV